MKNIKINLALFALIIGLFLIFGDTAQAATLTVTKTADTNDGVCNADCSLREAFDVADGNTQTDTINFNIPAADAGCGGTANCTITLASVIQPAADGGNLTTVSGTGGNVITLSGGNATKLFDIFENVKISMSFLILANGNGVSAASSGFGGAIAIFGAGSQLTLDNATVRNNSATFGGAINASTSSTLTVTNSIIRNNSATSDGGISVFGTATLTNSTVSNNSATNSTAGGIYVDTNANLTLTNSTVSGNSATTLGGGIYNIGTATLIASTVSNNLAGSVGGGIVNFSTANLTNSTVSGNSSIDAGGGINNQNGTVTLTGSTVSGNSSTNSNGGGIRNFTTLTLINSTISGNSAFSSDPTLGNGGGIRNTGTATLTSSTISNNSASAGGGGVSNAGGTTTLNNTIIANSLAGGDCVRPGGTINATYSLIEQNLTCVNGTNSNNLTGDPNLGPLANNGGSTQTHALLPGSIAIDTGNSVLTTDQRGAPRPVDNPNSPNGTGNLADIGAYEAFESARADLSLLLTASTPVTAGGNLLYTIRVGNNGPATALGVVVTAQIPANTTYQTISFPQGWKCRAPTGNRGNVRCTKDSFAVGEDATFALRVRVNPTTPVGATITNQARIDTDTDDPNMGNNATIVSSTVTGGGGGTRKD